MVCMEMMLAGVKVALTRQQFRVPQDLRDLAAAQEAIGPTTPKQRHFLHEHRIPCGQNQPVSMVR